MVGVGSAMAVAFPFRFGTSAPAVSGSAESVTRTVSAGVSGTRPIAHFALPAEREFYETAFRFAVPDRADPGFGGERIVGGIVPHHLLAADLIAGAFRNMEGQAIETVVLIGPDHFSAGKSDITVSDAVWKTPYGPLEPDRRFLDGLSSEKDLDIRTDTEGVMAGEHAVAGLVAFVKRTFPDAKFVPMTLKSGVSEEAADVLGEAVHRLSLDRRILVLASVDFSHGRTAGRAEREDRESIETVACLDFPAVYGMAVDSPPSVRTILRFADLNRAGFALTGNSNSAVLTGHPDLAETTSYVTGLFVSGVNYPPAERPVRLLFLGDLMLDRHVRELIAERGLDHIFGRLDDEGFFVGHDLIGANLEGTVTDGGAHYEPVKAYDFAFEPETVARLAGYGFGYFSLANNHFADQGRRGMDETRANLTLLGFAFSGDRDGLVSGFSTTVSTIRGKRVALVGLSDVGVRLDAEKAASAVTDAKAASDFTVVNIHWGTEYDPNFSSTQQSLAHRLVEAGADAVIGHHPHVIQGSESYMGKPIFYSLGNFVFDQYFSEETQRGLAVSLELSGTGVSFSAIPLRSERGRVFTESGAGDGSR